MATLTRVRTEEINDRLRLDQNFRPKATASGINNIPVLRFRQREPEKTPPASSFGRGQVTEPAIKTVTGTQLKQKLKVFVDGDNKYITLMAYRILNKKRAIMLEEDSLVEVTEQFLNSLQNIDLEYIPLDKTKEVEKQRIIVYVDEDNNAYIDASAAFALNLINTEEYMSGNIDRVAVSENLMQFILAKYTVETVDIGNKKRTQ